MAESCGEIVGSNLATRWGSFGFFGPFGIRPDQWDQGVGGRVMAPIMDTLAAWNVRLAGIFTFAQSPKHVGMYQKFGFYPRYLTAIMGKSVPAAAAENPQAMRYSRLSASEKDEALAACREVADRVFDGLDLTDEIRAIDTQKLGDTVLLWENSMLKAFAACHQGSGTEAGGNTCYVKFAAVRPGTGDRHTFETLLGACEAYAGQVFATRLTAGINTARREAYGWMCQNGFRIDRLGIAMHKPDDAGFSRPGLFVLDDWR